MPSKKRTENNIRILITKYKEDIEWREDEIKALEKQLEAIQKEAITSE